MVTCLRGGAGYEESPWCLFSGSLVVVSCYTVSGLGWGGVFVGVVEGVGDGGSVGSGGDVGESVEGLAVVVSACGG